MTPMPASTAPAPRSAHVPNELVHKHQASEVLLTGWRRTAQDSFTVTARWPTDHAFYAVRHTLHDPLLLTETVRQIFPLLSHVAYDVPLGHHLVWDTYDYSLTRDALHAEYLPASLDLHVTCLEEVRRGPRVAALTLRIDAVRGGLPLATSHTRFTVQSPAIYRRLRAGHGETQLEPVLPLPSPVPPSRLGRTSCRDVVLSPSEAPDRWQLRVDNRHPILFDHPLDHVPGMLLLEAARQAAQGMCHRRAMVAVAMENRFSRYVEFDAPCWVEAQPLPDDALGRTRIGVVMRQNGTERYSTIVTLEPAPAPAARTNPARTGCGHLRRSPAMSCDY
ncbi:ScbA/BarX family gamma-butyrolactone biosynthesis protein [Streptomyces sp. NPDC086554]|uniref:ScbA/BarX family gamma-butyrolactone biosynthesis protein n=1 Tax=Streptomyces sp. NPDC086554 TaxID=3154864 RepID=UPI003416EF1C